jgi:hypothetical protein
MYGSNKVGITGASAIKLAQAKKLEWHPLQDGNASLSKMQDGA